MTVDTGYRAKVITDSVHNLGPEPCRLMTLELTFPRFVLAEFNTHRVFSRNSASSRAIPVTKQIRRILDYPFVPAKFGRDKKGMQAGAPLTGRDAEEAREIWVDSMHSSVAHASALLLGRQRTEQLGILTNPTILRNEEARHLLLEELSLYTKNRDNSEDFGYLGVHKQTANRLLEPYAWHTVIVTSTEWSNFIALRNNKDAQPEIQIPTEMALVAMDESTSHVLGPDEWHLPLIQEDERALITEDNLEMWKKISAGRCARVSYETHDGERNIEEDIRLCNWLISDGHMSPLEHVARPLAPISVDGGAIAYAWSGNFRGWHQFRKDIKFENDYAQVLMSR